MADAREVCEVTDANKLHRHSICISTILFFAFVVVFAVIGIKAVTAVETVT
jgi:purine-cytosine permease-like protein